MAFFPIFTTFSKVILKILKTFFPIFALFEGYPEEIENILSNIHKLFEQNQTNIIRLQKIGEMMGGNWIKLPLKGTIPSAKTSHAIAVIGLKFYVFGGEFTPRVPVDNELFSFDTLTNEWTFLSSGESCTPHRSYHSMISEDHHVYVFGGCGNNGRLNDRWAFDMKDYQWTQLPSPGKSCCPHGQPRLIVTGVKV